MKTGWLSLFLVLALAGCAGQNAATQRGQEGGGGQESVNQRARIHTELAAQYYSRRQFAVALQELRIALEADAAYPPAYNMLGMVHAELLEDKEAEASFRRSIALAPEYSEVHNNFGAFLCARKRRAEAMEHFETAWKNPLYATPELALANAGLCALREGDLAEAERFAQRALIRADNQPQAVLIMAEVRYRRGDLAAARTMLRQAEGQGGLGAGGLWLAVRLERAAGNREAEASYGLQLRRYYPEAQESAWLLSGRYDMPGGRP
ncbi:MAG: type IV pilus biogenesis/stability protein PilW [Thiobacillus sp.]|nr:type IV pilus biogenesis/stability protein PilW [Thiobacillus sp.]